MQISYSVHLQWLYDQLIFFFITLIITPLVFSMNLEKTAISAALPLEAASCSWLSSRGLLCECIRAMHQPAKFKQNPAICSKLQQFKFNRVKFDCHPSILNLKGCGF